MAYIRSKKEELTGYQASGEIRPSVDLGCDFIMVYGIDPTMPERIRQYREKGYGYGVCYSLEKGISEGFSKNGFPIELGRMRVKCGCNWVAIPGREYPLQDVTRVNMAVALHYGLKDLQAQETRDLDLLWERFTYHLQAMVECVKAGYDKHYEVMQRNRPEIVLNLFMHGPIERGLNCSNGGVDILDLNIDGIALATVADSFAAIEQRVVEEEMPAVTCCTVIRLHPEKKSLPTASPTGITERLHHRLAQALWKS